MSGEIVQIDIKYLPGAMHMQQIDKGGCIDAYVYEDTFIKAGTHGLVNLGFSCKLPEGWDAWLIPCRSSSRKRYKIRGITGYIDNSYNGNDDIWYASIEACDEDVFLPAGTRAFQWRLVPAQPTIIFNQVANLNESNRGGFGEGTRDLD